MIFLAQQFPWKQLSGKLTDCADVKIALFSSDKQVRWQTLFLQLIILKGTRFGPGETLITLQDSSSISNPWTSVCVFCDYIVFKNMPIYTCVLFGFFFFFFFLFSERFHFASTVWLHHSTAWWPLVVWLFCQPQFCTEGNYPFTACVALVVISYNRFMVCFNVCVSVFFIGCMIFFK